MAHSSRGCTTKRRICPPSFTIGWRRGKLRLVAGRPLLQSRSSWCRALLVWGPLCAQLCAVSSVACLGLKAGSDRAPDGGSPDLPHPPPDCTQGCQSIDRGAQPDANDLPSSDLITPEFCADVSNQGLFVCEG